MTIDPDIAHRALRKNTDKIVCDGGIDPFVLARKLDSAELITDDVYRQCTDRNNDWSDCVRVEHIIKQIRIDIQKDGKVFNEFLKVLHDAGHQHIVDILSSTYQDLLKKSGKIQTDSPIDQNVQKKVVEVLQFSSEETGKRTSSGSDQLLINEESRIIVTISETNTQANPVASKQGYEQFSDISKYGEPKLPELMDMVVTKIPAKWDLVGTQLGFSYGDIEGYKMDISLGGKPIKLFQELISNWSRKFPETYNWGVMLKVLSSPTVGERRLANEIASKLKGEPYEGPVPEQPVEQRAVDVKRLSIIITDTLDRNYAKLGDALYNSLPSFGRLMLQAALIPRDVCRKAEYNGIMHSFQAGLALRETSSELEHDCSKFVNALKEVGGPAKFAAERIAKQWNDRVQSEFGVKFYV